MDLRGIEVPRKAVRWAGVVVGVAAGWHYLFVSMRIFGGEPGPVDWIGFATIVARFLAQFFLLPVSLVGIFRPRAAAYAVAVGFSVSAALSLRYTLLFQIPQTGYFSISGLASFSLHWIVVPGAVAALLFYGSGRRADASMKGAAEPSE